MRPAPRLIAAAGLMSLVALTGACTSDQGSGESTSSGPSGPTGCDGAKAPTVAAAEQAYDSVAQVGEGKAVGVQSSKPSMTEASSGAKGWSVAKVTVHARVLTNGVYAISPDSVMLIDPKGRQCTRPRTNAVPSPLAIGEIDEKESASGTVSFLVPEDADLSKYKVVYADDPGAKTAEAQWSARGVAPTPTAAAAKSCTPGRLSPITLDEVERTEYGDSKTIGSSLKITASKPKPIPLKPSDKHPNDVDGLAVNVKVTATGSAAFIDRPMFQLIDGTGAQCRYAPLGDDGETLSTDLVPDGETNSYTLIFWAPKGQADQLKQLQLIFRSDVNSNAGAAGWWDPKEKAAYPSQETLTKRKKAAAKASASPGPSTSSSKPSSSSKATPSESGETTPKVTKSSAD